MPGFFLVNGNQNNDICFGIFHVRLATVIIGIWQIIVNFVIIGILGYILFFHVDIPISTKALIDDIINGISLGQRKDFIFNVKEKYIYYSSVVLNDSMNKSTNRVILSNKIQDYYIDLTISVFTISCCVMMIYGCIKVKSSSIMPYFCIEVFYFMINSLTLISEFSGMPLKSEYDKQHRHTTYFRYNNRSRHLNILIFMSELLLLMLNLYILNAIWACNKFLLRVKRGLELDGGFSMSCADVSARLQQSGFIGTRVYRFIRRRNVNEADVRSLMGGDVPVASPDQQLSTGLARQSNLTLEQIEKEDISLPTYEQILKCPANANMPPPYYPDTNSP